MVSHTVSNTYFSNDGEKRQKENKDKKTSCVQTDTTDLSNTLTLNKKTLNNHTRNSVEIVIKDSSDTRVKKSKRKYKRKHNFDPVETAEKTKVHYSERIKRSDNLYHPEVVTKYIINRQVKLDDDTTLDDLDITSPNLINEVEYYAKTENIENTNLEDKPKTIEKNYYKTDLDTRNYLNKIIYGEQITTDETAMSNIGSTENIENFARFELNQLDYKNHKRDGVLDNLNDKTTEIDNKITIVKVRSDYIPKKIVTSKFIKEQDDGKDKTVTSEYRDGMQLMNNNEENYGTKVGTDLSKSDIANILEYTVRQKNENEDSEEYLQNAFELENTGSVEDPVKDEMIMFTNEIMTTKTEQKPFTLIPLEGLRRVNIYRSEEAMFPTTPLIKTELTTTTMPPELIAKDLKNATIITEHTASIVTFNPHARRLWKSGEKPSDGYVPSHWARRLHNLPRYDLLQMRQVGNKFDLTRGSNYSRGILLFAFGGVVDMILYLMLWVYFCRVSPMRLRVYKHNRKNKLMIFKSMLYLCASLSISAAFLGFLGVFTMHTDLYEVGQFSIVPILDTIDKMYNEIHTRMGHLQKLSNFTIHLNVSKELKPIRKNLNDTINKALSAHRQMLVSEQMSIAFAVRDYFKTTLIKERTIFALELTMWILAFPLPIVLLYFMKNYTYRSIKVLDYIRLPMLISMLFTMSVSCFMHYRAIEIADFCHNFTSNVMRYNPVRLVNNRTLLYYLTCKNKGAAINFLKEQYISKSLKDMMSMYSKLNSSSKASYDFEPLKQSSKRFVEYGKYIKECEDSKKYYEELRGTVCDTMLQGLLIQCAIAGPWYGFFLMLTLIALCRVRAWQKAILCIHLLTKKRCGFKPEMAIPCGTRDGRPCIPTDLRAICEDDLDCAGTLKKKDRTKKKKKKDKHLEAHSESNDNDNDDDEDEYESGDGKGKKQKAKKKKQVSSSEEEIDSESDETPKKKRKKEKEPKPKKEKTVKEPKTKKEPKPKKEKPTKEPKPKKEPKLKEPKPKKEPKVKEPKHKKEPKPQKEPNPKKEAQQNNPDKENKINEPKRPTSPNSTQNHSPKRNHPIPNPNPNSNIYYERQKIRESNKFGDPLLNSEEHTICYEDEEDLEQIDTSLDDTGKRFMLCKHKANEEEITKDDYSEVEVPIKYKVPKAKKSPKEKKPNQKKEKKEKKAKEKEPKKEKKEPKKEKKVKNKEPEQPKLDIKIVPKGEDDKGKCCQSLGKKCKCPNPQPPPCCFLKQKRKGIFCGVSCEL